MFELSAFGTREQSDGRWYGKWKVWSSSFICGINDHLIVHEPSTRSSKCWLKPKPAKTEAGTLYKWSVPNVRYRVPIVYVFFYRPNPNVRCRYTSYIWHPTVRIDDSSSFTILSIPRCYEYTAISTIARSIGFFNTIQYNTIQLWLQRPNAFFSNSFFYFGDSSTRLPTLVVDILLQSRLEINETWNKWNLK